MKKYSSSTKKLTIGLGVGDQHSYYVVLDGEAEVIEEGRIRTRQEELGKKFAGLPRSRVALEVGTHSRWISQLLQRLGHEKESTAADHQGGGPDGTTALGPECPLYYGTVWRGQ